MTQGTKVEAIVCSVIVDEYGTMLLNTISIVRPKRQYPHSPDIEEAFFNSWAAFLASEMSMFKRHDKDLDRDYTKEVRHFIKYQKKRGYNAILVRITPIPESDSELADIW